MNETSGRDGRPEGQAYDWFVRGRALYEGGDPAAAAELLAHAVAAEPYARSVRETWARALFDSRRYADAAREFLLLTEAAPDDHYAHFGAGLALWRQQQLSRSIEHLTMAVAMRPGRAEYDQARRQVRATIEARSAAGLPVDGADAGPSPGPAALTEAPLARAYDLALLDLDGVVYRGGAALPYAAVGLRGAQSAGMSLAYITNNASRPPGEVAAHLRELGAPADDDQVATSAQAAARLLADDLGSGARVLAVGGPGVDVALDEAGLTAVRVDPEADPYDAYAWRDAVGAVVIGHGPDVSWRDLGAASFAVQSGARLVATNRDPLVPAHGGMGPGNGTFVALVEQTTGVSAEVAGKPSDRLYDLAVARTGASRPLVVGDSLLTDIAGAGAYGADSLLVLSGVTGAGELLTAAPDRRPTYVAADLRGLLARGRRVVCGPAAGATDGRLTLDHRAPVDASLDRLRAAAAACWAAADAGTPLTVAPEVLAALTADVTAALDPATT